MIVVDSAALIAILFDEPEKGALNGVAAVGMLLADNAIEIIVFDEAQVCAAAIAYDRYGKGINPKARLNLADCAAYALAKTMNVPLLFKGNDFTETDIKSAI